MLKFFSKKMAEEPWIMSAKRLRKRETEKCKILTKEEIKEEILSNSREGQRRFYGRRIDKKDKKDLKRFGYKVYETEYNDGRVDVTIRW